jgi:hypothetical protein
MPHALHAPRTTSDRTWTAATVGLALVAVVLAVAGAYDAGALVALLGVLGGGWSMLISRTRTERFEVVTATVAAAVVLAACLAYGSGFSV